ncbi:MAG: lysylphosphatidylglycerol synthase transmembrane domain-containing protein [Candidatus Hodarchaeales archaeon]
MEPINETGLKKVLSFKNFAFGLVLAVLVYLILILIGNWKQLLKYLALVPISIILIALGLSFMNYLFRFFKWVLFTRSLNLTIPIRYNFKVFFAGLSLAITPAKAGEAIRAFLLRKNSNVDLSKGLASTFSERLIDLLAVTILSIGGILILGFKSNYLPIILVILLVIVISVIIFLFDPLYQVFSVIFHIDQLAFIGKNIDRFRSDVLVTFHLSTFLGALILGIIGWSFECLSFMLIAQSLHISMSFQMATFIYTTSSIIGAISFLPGGLGLMEGGLEFFLMDLLQTDYTLSVALTLLIRFTTLWFGVGIGLIFLLWSTKELKVEQIQIMSPEANNDAND